MANAVVPWDLRPEYLAYTDWASIPGITSYAFPRNGTGTDVTQFHPGQAFLSENHLPDIMYQLHPCEEWTRFKYSALPEPKQSADGSPVYEQWTRSGQKRRQLLDFKILPDKISTKEGWWYHEFVRRMDPRIRQCDIIMREEVSAERLRMSDSGYINLHLNTPGYRHYRPAWKMIAWHVTMRDDKQNQRKQSVLDDLTEAQRHANTTRGSTPGLINPKLGDTPGNRIPLPDLKIKKCGADCAVVSGSNNPATQTSQPARVPPAAPAPPVPPFPPAPLILQAPQATQASQRSQALYEKQIQQNRQSSRAKSFYDAVAPAPVVSAAVGASSQRLNDFVAAPVIHTPMRADLAHKAQNESRGYVNTQARDIAALQPPPLPVQPQNGQPIQHQASRSNPEPQSSTNPLPYLDSARAEIASMHAESERAMAAIQRMCEPFLDLCSGLPAPPPVALSARLVESLGLGCLYPNQTGRKVDGTRNENCMPKPAHTMQDKSVAHRTTPMLSQNQTTKRKEREEDLEDFQHVQLRQDHRPIKRVKSVHKLFSNHDNEAHYLDAAYDSYQQLQTASQPSSFQFGYTQGQNSNRRAMQGVQSPQRASIEGIDPKNSGNLYNGQIGSTVRQYTDQAIAPHYRQDHLAVPSPSGFPNYEQSVQSVASPYLSALTAREEVPDRQPWMMMQPEYFGNEQIGGSIGQYPDQAMASPYRQDHLAVPPPSGSPNYQQSVQSVASPYPFTFTAREGAPDHQAWMMIQPEHFGANVSYDGSQADQTLEAQFFEFPLTADNQYVSQRSTMLQPTSGAYRENHGEYTCENIQIYPYAHTKMCNPQSIEPTQTQQHLEQGPLPPVSNPGISFDDRIAPDVTSPLLEYTSTPEYVSDTALNPGDVGDNDSGQTLEVELAGRLQDWLSKN